MCRDHGFLLADPLLQLETLSFIRFGFRIIRRSPRGLRSNLHVGKFLSPVVGVQVGHRFRIRVAGMPNAISVAKALCHFYSHGGCIVEAFPEALRLRVSLDRFTHENILQPTTFARFAFPPAASHLEVLDDKSWRIQNN